ncbi:MAG: hypothetical protein H7A21_17275 [Spirochaetales bacterium]|nr:hypothetical protein [Leptospiraceae bacterium]MCP5483193.1 hypothetical protein [Spirochaetales bacterium]MCP5486697.1 hypothetical protein [Spirochaetales bacterium]
MQTEMEIDLTGDTSNVFEPTLPAVPGAAPGELRRRHNELGLTKCVSERNLSEARGVGEDFFAGIPSTDEVAREKKISATEAELHLAIACRTGGLACVRLESTHLPVHRKTEGFVARDWRIITVLLERLQAALQNEYQTRFNSVPSKKDIQKLYEARMSTVEATTLGRMTRLFVGLSDLEELLRAEAVEATTAIPGPSSEERTWLEIDRRATHAVESPTGPQAPSGPEPQRRAIDAPAWQNFEKDQGGKETNWEHSFRTLGPFFTVRILLRRELFHVLLAWLQKTPQHDDFSRVLADCETAYTKIGAANPNHPELYRLKEAIDTLTERVYGRAP